MSEQIPTCSSLRTESRQVRSIFFLLHQRLAVFSGSTTRPATIGVIRDKREAFDFSPAELDAVESRSDLLYRLKKKYGDSVEEMLDYIKASMARHKVPKYIDFVDAFPMNAAGKILKYKMREDAGDLATRSAKKYYNRIRPFKYYNVPTCNSKQEGELSTNGSYPSGHTTIGWAEALVLAEINPDRQNEILKRGFEMGQSRVICGYHWQSDVDAARVVASAVVARLHANKEFQKCLEAAKKEFAKLVKQGKVKKSEFVATPWDKK